MPKSPTVDVGDTVPMAVDRTQTLMAEQDVTKAITAEAQLSPMAIRVQETLGVDPMSAVADMGYSHGRELNACEAADLDAYVPKPSPSAHTKRGLFRRERFTDAPEKDCYRCQQERS